MTEPEATPGAGSRSASGASDTPAEPGAGATSVWRERVGFVLMVLIAAGLVYVVLRDRQSFVDTIHRVGAAGLVLSFLAAAVAVGFTGMQWRAVLQGMGVHFALPDALRVYFVSQLGKYLPGSVWPIVVQLEAARERGASRKTVLAANLVSLATGIATGLVVAAVTLPFASPESLRRYWWALAATPLIVVVALPKSLPWMLDKALTTIGREPLGVTMSPAGTLRACTWAVASWILFGVHLTILAAAVGDGASGLLVLCIGGMALAVCAGILFIPSPAGAGLREVVLAFVLSAVMTSGQAVAVVVGSRVVLIGADVVLAGIAALVGRAHTRRLAHRLEVDDGRPTRP